MTDETIEGAGIDKPFMELFFKGEQSNFREQIEDMETKKGNIIASSNADGSNKVEGKWTGNTEGGRNSWKTLGEVDFS